MGLLFLLGLPLAPVRGVIKLGELVQRQVEEQLHDPAVVRRELEEIDRRRAEGELSPEEEAEAQRQILERRTAQRRTNRR